MIQKWRGIYHNDQKRIIGLWGLALPEMKHRLTLAGQKLFTWCAWDTLFIPPIIQKTAQVESPCPITGEMIRLKVSPERIETLEPEAAVMSLTTPPNDKVSEDVVSNFCHYVYFFSSKIDGLHWTSIHDHTFIVPVQDAYILGKKMVQARYRENLETNKSLSEVSCTEQN